MEKNNKWYKQFTDKLELTGLRPRTVDVYSRAVKQLQDHYDRNPKKITELEVQEYLLYRKNTSKWAPATLNTALCGIRYYYQMMLNVNWELFRIAKFAAENKLPTVLTKEEVDRILRCARPFNNYVYLVLVYSCGLRLSEALNLEVSDIDRGRMIIHIHRGKGAKDRLVPLPHSTLKLLERYWKTHRHPRFIFPRTQTNKRGAPVNDLADDTVNKGCAQNAMRNAVKKANINKKGVSVHTLRHCYATHLLDSGVNLRYIQIYLGHSTILSTLVYLHLTAAGNSDAYGIIDNLMDRF
ncbi:integrase [Thiospirochaeta perfilievii]|uniref:Integrase n=1 Tax=Thiospirochaeta perfilievii TaxID=252967 RepID=A0A5C1QCB4_9SPIO|nr:site-specific integrase [Thiospirochaeta perfilievii]QEN04559.1 integrase [Thiospirochaeta perfilievii]